MSEDSGNLNSRKQLLCFSVEDEIKERLEKVCERLNINYDEFFMQSLIEAEFDVIVRNTISSSSEDWLLDEIEKFKKRKRNY